jgi:hypothetical protein
MDASSTCTRSLALHVQARLPPCVATNHTDMISLVTMFLCNCYDSIVVLTSFKKYRSFTILFRYNIVKHYIQTKLVMT